MITPRWRLQPELQPEGSSPRPQRVSMTCGIAHAEIHIDGTDWEYEPELALLDEDLSHIANQSRLDEITKMVNAVERQVKKQLLEPVEVALSKPGPDMWETVLGTYTDVSQSAESSLLTKAKGMGSHDNADSRCWM